MYTITTRQTIPRASQRNTAPQCALSPDRKGNVCRQMFRDIDADCYLMVDGEDTYPAEAAKASASPFLMVQPI